MQLRDYQSVLIERTRQAMRSHRNVLMQAPTGAGKTALTVFMMATAAKRGKRSIFLVHQSELLQQTSEALWKQHLAHGMICPGKAYSKLPVQVASVQTLVRRMDKYPEPDLIVIDEAHRAAASTYRKVMEFYTNARVIGLTATPQRTDGKGLDDLFDTIVEGPPVRSLINAGYLSEYELIAPPIDIDMSSIKTKMGDYDKKELESAVDRPTITGDAVAHYKRHAMGRRCVVMCVSIKHAEHVCAQYKAAGIEAVQIDGKMTNAERKSVIERFRRGEVKVICNVQLLLEGVDIPAISVVQWLRPTQSLIVWLQGCGRGLRPAPGKDKLMILDHVGNWSRHGIPDEDREWSLQGRPKGRRKQKDEEPDLQIQQCLSCFHVFKTGPDFCPSCGEPLPRKGRPELEVVDGELQKIDVEQIRRERKREQGKARTLEDLVALGMRRGFKKPDAWAAHTMAHRVGKKPTRADFQKARSLMHALQNPAENRGGEAF